MDVSRILQLIDYRTEELDGLFRKYHVLQYTESSLALPHTAKASSETIAISWLLSTNVAFVLLLALIVCLCLVQRAKYNRQIRAATVPALCEIGSSQGSILGAKKDSVPNTNIHATQGSNPIWMSGVTYGNMDFDGPSDHSTQVREERLSESIKSLSFTSFNFTQAIELGNSLEDTMDSLDANVLNAVGQGESEDDDQAGAGSTLRISSPKMRSTRSSSSGLGSSSFSQAAFTRTAEIGPPLGEPKGAIITRMASWQVPKGGERSKYELPSHKF